MTGIKFTLKVCETMVDGDDPRPCNKRKCKLDRKELITERKKSEVLRTEILTRAATAKRKKESKKAERRAQSNSTTLNITINPNLMVVIPSNIVIVEPRQPPTTSKTSMTPKTSKTPYRPSATPIPPSSSPKALETSHLNIPSASNMVKSVQSPKKANVPNSRMTGAPVGPPALETAGRMALSVKKPVSYQQPRQADRASLSTITSPVSLSSPRSADRTFLSVKKPMSSRASKKVDQNTSALISPLVSPPSPRTADRSVFHNKKALAYQASKKAKRHITSSTLSQSENYRVSKRSNNASRSIISTPKSQTAPTMVTRSKGLLTLISLFGFQGLERKRHKSKKDRSRDFPRIGLFWQ